MLRFLRKLNFSANVLISLNIENSFLIMTILVKKYDHRIHIVWRLNTPSSMQLTFQ